jgi:hypothetical protein
MSRDAGDSDAGADAGPVATTAACSCETALDSDGRIHLCNGSFDRATCRTFDCNEGTPRPERCPEKSVRLCCDMPERHIYENLYDDCTHPNCESGFRAQCSDFGGSVIVGACEAPALMDDPDTETGGSCSIATISGRPAGTSWLLVGLGMWLARRRKRV